jgi:O-antigen ligase
MARSGAKWSRLIGYAALVGIPGSIALTASRGAFLGLLACGLGLLFLSPGISLARRLAFVGAVTVALAVSAPAGYWTQMSTITNLEEDYNMTSDTGRMTIWKRGLDYVRQRPVFGVGPDNFIRAGWTLSMEARYGLGIKNQAPHNTFIQIWAETGTAGLLVFVSIILGGSLTLIRLRARLPRSWLKGTADQRFLYLLAGYLPVSFMGFSVAAFFVTHGYTAMFYILTAFLSATLMLTRQERQNGRTGTRARPMAHRSS